VDTTLLKQKGKDIIERLLDEERVEEEHSNWV